MTLARLTQWRLDFRVVRQAPEPERREAGLRHLVARWAPIDLLKALNGEAEEGRAQVVGVIEDVLSTEHGRELWTRASVDVVELVVQGCRHRDDDNGHGESSVRATCARLLEEILGGRRCHSNDSGAASDSSGGRSHLNLLSPTLAMTRPKLMRAVIDLVASPDTDVSSAASNVVTQSAPTASLDGERAALFRQLVASLLQARAEFLLENADAAAGFRLLDVAVSLAGVSEDAFREVSDAGLFAALEDALSDDADDVLLQMAIMESIGRIATTPYVCRRLVGDARDGDDRAEALHDMLCDIAGVPLPEEDDSEGGNDGEEENATVRNGAIRILANIYSTLLKPGEKSTGRTTSLLRGLVKALEKALAAADSTSMGVCMQVVRGMANASPACAQIVISSTNIVETMVKLCVDREDERRALGLHAMADVVRGICPSFPNANADGEGASGVTDGAGRAYPDETGARRAVHAIGQAWEAKTGTPKDTMLVLLDYAKEPLAHTRHGSFDLLAAVAGMASGWGLRRLFGRSELRAFLFDRRTESSKEGKEWKFGVLAAAFHCPSRGSVLGGDEAEKELREFLQDGPFSSSRSALPAEVVGLHL